MNIIANVIGPSRDSSVTDQFRLVRPSFHEPSNQWILMGAVRSNNFGAAVERVMFVCACCHRPLPGAEDALRRIQNDWTWKNGSQKWYALDYDHGSTRQWCAPEGYSIRMRNPAKEEG